MSTALLQELHQEVRRLYIAGSELAAGDFRLRRLLPQFEQLGERAAVFKRLSEGISSLVEAASGQEPSPAIQLQELTLLLESVLYTQGVTVPDGEPVTLQSRPLSLDTKLPYRKLAVVRQALTTTGSGRYEVVTEAFKNGMFQDLRMLPLAISALNDPYAEIADFAMSQILPSYGLPIADYLIESFNPHGGKSEVRKLNVIGQVGGTKWLDRIYGAAVDGSDDIRVAAIACLSGHEEYTTALLDWTMDKRKVIREAAFAALAAGGSLQGGERLLEAFAAKKDRALVAEAVYSWPSVTLTEPLSSLFMSELHEALQEIGDKKKQETLWNEIQPFLTALSEQRNSQLDEIYSYVIQEYSRFVSLGWLPLIDQAARYLESAGSDKELELLRELEKQNSRYLPNYFRAAQQLLSPEDLYKRFVGSTTTRLKALVTKDSAQRAHQLLETLERQVMNAEQIVYDVPWELSRDRQHTSWGMPSTEKIAEGWDPRWLDWFIDRDSLSLASTFARPGHAGVRSYIMEKLQEQGKRRSHEYMTLVFTGLERSGIPESERLELLMSVLENDRLYDPYMFDFYLFNLMLRFPARYYSRIEAIVPRYRYECKSQLDYLLNHLRTVIQ